MDFVGQQELLSMLLGDPNTSADDMFPLALRKTYLNRGEMHFCADTKIMKEYVTAVIVGSSFALPADFLEIVALHVNNIDTTALEVSVTEYERYLNSGDNHWYIWEDGGVRSIYFTSSQNGATYKLWYTKKPTSDLTDDDDTNDYPDQYREAGAYWAASELLEQIGKTELSNRYLQKYSAFVEDARNYARNMYKYRPPISPDMGDGDYPSSVDRQGHGQLY